MERQKRKVGRPRKRLNLQRLVELRAQGLGYRQIARRTGYALATIYARLREINFGEDLLAVDPDCDATSSDESDF